MTDRAGAPAAGTASPRTLPSGEPRPQYNLDRLLAVAVAVFTERGYEATSFAHLSHASGLSKSSIFHHIEGKEQLLRLGLQKALDPLIASTTEDGAVSGRAVDRLIFLIRRNLEILTEKLTYVTLLLNVRGNTETERWALEQRRSYDKFVADVVQEAIADGDLRSDIDARTTARLIFGMTNSVREWYRPDGPISGAQLADQVSSMLMDGMKARP
ncbi:TetR/AcrR family transcriptional regulator [Mycobacterium sp. AT1]|uniref:TetR/AcrR family transcriptional regulator n=1 Tax=Mycobacterium sp. AT1 TaxID=1961706 RepID=UPI0009AE77AC|nr:TetR/AcrR family transcriptional regulator [Mycobacterium sp. AT1]